MSLTSIKHSVYGLPRARRRFSTLMTLLQSWIRCLFRKVSFAWGSDVSQS